MTIENKPTCSICGEPMPPGEEMFKFHGYSGPCPKPPLTAAALSTPSGPVTAGERQPDRELRKAAHAWHGRIIDAATRCDDPSSSEALYRLATDMEKVLAPTAPDAGRAE